MIDDEDDDNDDNDDNDDVHALLLLHLFVLLQGGEHWATALPEDYKHNGHAWGTERPPALITVFSKQPRTCASPDPDYTAQPHDHPDSEQ